MTFDIERFRGSAAGSGPTNGLARQLARISADGKNAEYVKSAVDKALENIRTGKTRFVIYGEPQSGKTEMMIALTAGLLDGNHSVVIVLVNDSVQLLDQNLSRFQRASLDPTPRNFLEVLDPSVDVKVGRHVIFAKKNQADLGKLLDKVKRVAAKVIVDDEADYASPNSKVNQADKTRINSLITDLLGNDGVYIGVTATPARLDLNTTFDNSSSDWVNFPPHQQYTGQGVFFPVTKQGIEQDLGFRLVTMPAVRDDQKFLRQALFSFMVGVAHLDVSRQRSANYSMLVHTSGRKADHERDRDLISKFFAVLSNPAHSKFEQYVREVWEIARARFPDLEDDLTSYVADHASQNTIVVMNSNSPAALRDYGRATDPVVRFTVAVGGNIVSRGVTFNNLLSMFFTREATHRMQQDTYIQRARMFGGRQAYLSHFELYIPSGLYLEWQRCFIFHRLSLKGITEGLGFPLWLEDDRIKPAQSNSVNQAKVQWSSGEMYWDIFELDDAVRAVVGRGGTGLDLVKRLRKVLPDSALLPDYVVDFMEDFSPSGDGSVAVHPVTVLTTKYRSANQVEITRDKGFMAENTLERGKYPNAMHHVKIFANEVGKARVYYKYAPDPGNFSVTGKRISFIKRR